MAITFLWVTSTGENDGGDASLELEGGNEVVEGDLLLAFAEWGSRDELPDILGIAQSTETPWDTILSYYVANSLDAGTFGSALDELNCCYHIVTAGEDWSNAQIRAVGSADLSDSAALLVMAFRGVSTTAPFIANGVAGAQGISTNPNPPAVTPGVADCGIVIAAGSDVSDETPGTVAGGYTIAQTVDANDTQDITISAGYLILTGNAGVEQNPAAWNSWIAGSWQAATIVLSPPQAAADAGNMFRMF